MHNVILFGLTTALAWTVVAPGRHGTAAESPRPAQYRDGRPTASYRLDAVDHGVVLHHGDGPDQCDILGARDVWVYESDGTYYMHYDAAGPKGWLAALATSKDLIHWQKQGPVLELGKPDACGDGPDQDVAQSRGPADGKLSAGRKRPGHCSWRGWLLVARTPDGLPAGLWRPS